jgi:hypothetical protein
MSSVCQSCQTLPISSIQNCKEGIQIEKTLGSGDFGTTYSLATEIYPGSSSKSAMSAVKPDGRLVLKKIKLMGIKQPTIVDYEREICVQRGLGSSGISPKIHDCWICPDRKENQLYGYIIMDRMTDMWESKYGTKIASKEHQIQLIHAVIKMVQSGYLHQDLHIGNIGFMGDKVVIFDFGLSIPITGDNTQQDLSLCVASQLFIIYEQYSITNKNGTAKNRNYVRDVVHHILNNPEITLIGLIESCNLSNIDTIPIAQKLKKTKSVLLTEQKQYMNDTLQSIRTSRKGYIMDMVRLINALYLFIEPFHTADNDMDDTSYSSTNFPGMVYDAIYETRLGHFRDIVHDTNVWINIKTGYRSSKSSYRSRSSKSGSQRSNKSLRSGGYKSYEPKRKSYRKK